MTQISINDVQHLAQLSNLLLDESEVDALRADIEGILGHVEQLKELNTDGIEPTYQVIDLENVTRSDEIIDDGVSREALIELAADSKNNQIKVPKVLSW